MSLLNRACKPGCSLGTSVHSALETFVTMRYIKLHLPLPLPLLYIMLNGSYTNVYTP